MVNQITVRPATPGDASLAASLLWDTCGRFGDAFFGLGNHSKALDALEWFFARPKCRLGYHLARMLEVDGRTAGLLLSFRGRDLWRWQAPMAGLIFNYYGLADGLRLLWRSTPLWFVKEMEKSDYYIAHLAIDATHRGQGYGRLLLQEAENLARVNGLSRCSLLVDLDNQDARRLYTRMGYQSVEVHRAGKREKNDLWSAGSERMVKILDQKE
jgi:ribosomal protein S18 acetylase RimI-like enzyme